MLYIENIKKKEDNLEMAELKGEGHPDTICDTLCELSSKALSQYYLKHFNQVLHHNVDKGLLVAGTSKPEFKGGKTIDPIKIIIAGRATTKVEDKKIPAEKIIIDTCNSYLKKFDLAKFKVSAEIKPGASNLKGIAKKHVANDTSFGVSHYPYSKLEQLILDVDKFIASLRKQYKAIGRDIKIMGLKEKNKISLTIAIAFIGKYIKDMDDYIKTKKEIQSKISKKFKVFAEINTLDDYKDVSSVYLTVSGLSSEQGDDGQVGRGNRYNGLITPYKPMSLEAVSGKNIYHPGKLYQILAFEIAKDLVKEGADYAEVKILSQIGASLDNPQSIHVSIDGNIDAKKVIKRNLKNLEKLQKKIIFS